MPRVEFWAGGGACPQGYPVPAFRFTRELDRGLSRTCFPFKSTGSSGNVEAFFSNTNRSSDLPRGNLDQESIKLVGTNDRTFVERDYKTGRQLVFR